jgi:hypothetical protein
VYVAVLGTSLLVVAIGLGSLAVARSRMAASIQDMDGLRAREVAEAALDDVLRRLAAGTAWRETTPGAPWLEAEPFAGGTTTVWLADPDDDDLADDEADPVRVRIEAEAGGAVRRLEAIVDLQRRVHVLEPRVAAPNGIVITDAAVTGEGAMRSAGPVTASGSEVHLDVVSAEAVSGSAYHGVQMVRSVSGSVPTFADLSSQWAAGATAIDSAVLPVGGTPLEGWDLGAESTEHAGDWVIDRPWCNAYLVWGIPDMNAVEGAAVLLINDRWWDVEGAFVSVKDLLNSGTKPRMQVRVRLGDAADAPMQARLVLRYQYRTWVSWGWFGWWKYSSEFVHGGAVKSVGEDWVDLEVSADHMSWDPATEVHIAEIEIVTPGSTAAHLIDDGQLFDSALDADAPLLLHRLRLGPDSNPFGTPNSDGRYVIDLGGRDLVIRDCVIRGTLVLRNAGPGTRIEDSVAWEPVVPGDPIVIVEGTLTVAGDGRPVHEQTIGVDLDGDGARGSTMPAVLDGLIYATGRLTVQGRPTFGGSLVTRNGVHFDAAEAHFAGGRGDPDRIPAGFAVDDVVTVVRPGTLSTLGFGGGN